MTKKRVHELAKQLQKPNKELIDFLQKNNVEVQSHMSALNDDQVKMVEKAFNAGGEAKGEAPKKRISAVFRPQNSSQKGNFRQQKPGQKPAGAPQGQRPQGQKPATQAAAADKTVKPQQQPASEKTAPARPVNENIQAAAVKEEKPTAAPTPQAQLAPNTQPVNRPQGQGYQGNRPQGQGYQGNRPQGDRPQGQGYQGNRPQGQGYQGNRPQGDRPQGQGYQGNRPQGQGYQGNRPQGDRPQGQGYQGNRPQGQGYQGNRPQGDRPQGQGYQGNRPQGQGYQGNRPQGQGYQGDRPQGQGYQGNRPQGQGYQGNRPQGQGYQGNRPQGQGYQGNRPQGQGYQGDRPQGQGYQGNRPQGQGGYQGNRPQGQGGYQGNRPQGQGGYQGNRPQGQGGYQGNRPQGQGGYQGNRPQGQGGYQGRSNFDNKDGGGFNRGPAQGQRGGQRTGGKSGFDLPAATQKPQNTRQNKGKPTSKYDKKNAFEDNLQKASKNKAGRFQKPVKVVEPVEDIKVITIPERLTIKELAEKMKKQPSAIVKKLFLEGKVVTLNQEIDFAMAEEIALEYEIICEQEVKIDVLEELLKDTEDSAESLQTRPPVVCVMGHVDHGKTSLLDAIRESNVTSREAGGITQHIGAYVIENDGQKITFLDTPGHEAFTAMRMRGAQATDIAILVVAADDGVMPQTVEAISHAKAAGVEIIVAINKIDKPSANIDRVKQELSEHELVSEDWGGSTIFVPVSAHTKEGIDTLLEMILLVAEVKELKSNPDRTARGLVIEAELDKGKGPVATVLVQKGTLRVGDAIAAGACFGKVRAMMDHNGRRVKEAGPSIPVEILGLNDVPTAGEIFVNLENDKEARNFAETFVAEGREKLLEDTKAKLSLDDLFTQIKAGNVKELNLIVKADVQGSVEAVKQSLLKLSNEEVVVKIIHGGVGAINESDVSLASTSNAIIIGFNVRPDVSAKSAAEREKVDLRLYKVIYQAIEDVETAMKGMLDPIFEEKVLGHAVVRQTFKASGIGTIAGAYVMDGKFQRGCSVRITREGKQIFEGPLASLKRFKDDVKEVATGYECGLVFEKFNDIIEDDMVEAYTMVEVPR